MEANKKLYRYGLALVLIILLAAYGYTYSIRLDEPIYLENYMDIYITQDGPEEFYIDIYYITNALEDNEISYIDLKGDQGEFIQGLIGPSSLETDRRNYGIYDLVRQRAKIYKDHLDKDFDYMEFTKANIHFVNNKPWKEIDLGEIAISKYQTIEDKSFYENYGPISDGGSKIGFYLDQDIKLIRFESDDQDKMEEFFDIKINEVDYKEIEGLEIAENRSVNIDLNINNDLTLEERFTQFDIKGRLYYEDSQGNEDYFLISGLKYSPFYNNFKNKEIRDYVRLRGEGDV